MKNYCVYIHKKASNGKPFYVGKGKPARPKSKIGRSDIWNRTVKKHGLEVAIVKSGMNESCAFSLEKALIFSIGRENLYNLTDGGEGTSGRIPSESQRIKCSISNKGNKPDPRSIELARKKNSKPVGTRCGLRFPSATAAAKKVKPENWKAAKSSICTCANGRTKHAYGYEWGYINGSEPAFQYENQMSKPRPKRWKAVRCSNGIDFDAVGHAVTWLKGKGFLKASTGAICRAAKTGAIAYGLNWSYV